MLSIDPLYQINLEVWSFRSTTFALPSTFVIKKETAPTRSQIEREEGMTCIISILCKRPYRLYNSASLRFKNSTNSAR